MTSELRGEILAWNFIAQTTYMPRLERIIRKLERLMAAADALRSAAAQPPTEAPQSGVQ